MVYVMVWTFRVAALKSVQELNMRFQPNLVPPITSVAMALEYRTKLEALEPNVTFLMSLFLCPEVTPEVIVEAKKAGIRGVKSYPVSLPKLLEVRRISETQG